MEDLVKKEITSFNQKMVELNGLMLRDALISFFELSAMLNVVVDRDGTILMINSAWTQLLGWQKHELVNRSFAEIIHPDDFRHSLAVFRAIMYRKRRVDGFMYRCRCRNGSYEQVVWNAVISSDGRYGFGIGRVVGQAN